MELIKYRMLHNHKSREKVGGGGKKKEVRKNTKPGSGGKNSKEIGGTGPGGKARGWLDGRREKRRLMHFNEKVKGWFILLDGSIPISRRRCWARVNFRDRWVPWRRVSTTNSFAPRKISKSLLLGSASLHPTLNPSRN